MVSQSSIQSNNVMDEIAYALEERKLIIPLLVEDCRIPFRLRRLQYIDFRSQYQDGIQNLLRSLTSGGQLELPARPGLVTNNEQALSQAWPEPVALARQHESEPEQDRLASGMTSDLPATDHKEKAGKLFPIMLGIIFAVVLLLCALAWSGSLGR